MASTDPQLRSTLYRHRRGEQRPLTHHLAFVEGPFDADAEIDADVVFEVIDGPLGAFVSLKVSDPAGLDLDPAALRVFVAAAQEALMVMEHCDRDHGLQVAA